MHTDWKQLLLFSYLLFFSLLAALDGARSHSGCVGKGWSRRRVAASSTDAAHTLLHISSSARLSITHKKQ